MRTVHCFLFGIMLVWTMGLYAQTSPQSQETVDAVQNQRISRAEADTAANKFSIDVLTVEMHGLRSSLDRFTGIGMGLGASLTALQALLVIVTIRNGNKRGNT